MHGASSVSMSLAQGEESKAFVESIAAACQAFRFKLQTITQGQFDLSQCFSQIGTFLEEYRTLPECVEDLRLAVMALNAFEENLLQESGEEVDLDTTDCTTETGRAV